jgi:hypothetical protein
MQIPNLRRGRALLAAACVLAACSRSVDSPYAGLEDPPLVQAYLHTVTLVSDDVAIVEQTRKDGYRAIAFATNYPASIAVEAALWGVPGSVAAKPVELGAPTEQGPNLRILVMPLAAHGPTSNPATEADFFRNVLGTDVPRWPATGKLADNVRVQAWTYFVDNVVQANKRLRENGIPVVFDPVAITTPSLGDHKTMAIRAPDGTVVELVEAAAR